AMMLAARDLLEIGGDRADRGGRRARPHLVLALTIEPARDVERRRGRSAHGGRVGELRSRRRWGRRLDGRRGRLGGLGSGSGLLVLAANYSKSDDDQPGEPHRT